jgi:O-antigen/teichoic acid export membrane protein
LSASEPERDTGDAVVAAGELTEHVATEPDSPPRALSIGQQAGRGLRWALAGTVIGKLGSFAMSLVLARLLVPSDFGLFAIALSATQFAIHVNDMGVIAATSQWRGRVEDMIPTGTTVALLFSAGWFALFWVAAPWFAALAGSPEATPVVRLLTATILIDGVTAVRVGMLQRRFQQDKLTMAILAGLMVNAPVAIILAARGAGPYSFVVGQLCQSVVTGAIVLYLARLPFRLGFDREVGRMLLRFGTPLAAGLAAESALLYSDSIVVGHVLGPVLLGFYLLAFNVSSWIPGILSTAVRYVSIPGFSRLAEQGDGSLALGVQKSVTLMAAIVVPLAVGLATLSPALVSVLYGDRWLPASEPLRFLAVVMFARLVTTLAFDVQTSLGNTKVPIQVNLVWLLFLVPALYVGVRLGGISGAAAAHAVVAVLVAIPVIVWSLTRSGITLRPVIAPFRRVIVAGTVAAAVMLAVAKAMEGLPVLQLLVGGVTGVAAYLVVVVPVAAWPRLFSVMRRRHRLTASV